MNVLFNGYLLISVVRVEQPEGSVMNKSVAIGMVVLSLAGVCSCMFRSGSTKKSDAPIAVKKGGDVDSLVTTKSGLKYKVLVAPVDGAQAPSRGSVAQVHYTGWLADANDQDVPDLNKKFDSSVDRKQPFAFRVGVGMVIAGWDEGVLGMRVGEERRFIIPSHLGYGAQGAGKTIPANATLVFDVKLLNVS